jgi:2-dehydro-3-deoxyphosphogluconate aldolase/(4S)-4-hydroxy-2-oxoglutarate aldolase
LGDPADRGVILAPTDRSPVERIGAARLLPVIRTTDAAEAIDVVGRLVAAGLTVVELTATTSDWPAAVERVRADHPDVCLGLGTVLDARTAQNAIASGAQFLVSPSLAPDVRQTARDSDVLFIEGGQTPTELITALEIGGIAKLFPAHVGGPAYLRSLLSVAPGAKIVPTGGIPLGQIAEWLDAGAYAVGVGRDLTASGDIEARIRDLDLPVVH